MRRLLLLLCILCFFQISAQQSRAQTDIQAHYADGQVWVVWTFADSLETIEIHGSDQPVTTVSETTWIGRPFLYEYTPGAAHFQFGPESPAGYVIPGPGGTGSITLESNQGLFVETVHASGPRYYAVVDPEAPSVIPGINATVAAVIAEATPTDPPQAHFQFDYVPEPGFTSAIYYMWADGRQDENSGRPDFPIMANRAKNGMPSLFIMSRPDDLTADQPRPVSYWLHGGSGKAISSVPGGRLHFGVDPVDGILVAHQDDLVRWTDAFGEGAVATSESMSWWFGWGRNLDPFPGASNPHPGDTIINYTQRRLVWIHQWLVGKGWVDPQRTSILGHSMGSAGTLAMGKAFPSLFSSCSVMSDGFRGPAEAGSYEILGTRNDALYCNLVNASGDSLLVYDIFDLNIPLTDDPDMPFIRLFSGKNDENDAMHWGSDVVQQFVTADSLGWGMQIYWDMRRHFFVESDQAHWMSGYDETNQTRRENVEYQNRFISDASFPAFYNHRLQNGAPHPGDGTPQDGDPWGTWGGYHDWDPASVLDGQNRWEAEIALVSGSNWLVDNCPFFSLRSDLTIRRASFFHPQPGEMISFFQINSASGDTIRSETVMADDNGRVRISNLRTYRDPEWSRIVFERPGLTPIGQTPAVTSRIRVHPNPFNPSTTISYELVRSGPVTLRIFDMQGRLVKTLYQETVQEAGRHEAVWFGRNNVGRLVASGAYLGKLDYQDGSQRVRLMLIK